MENNQIEIAKKLNESVTKVIGSDKMMGFEKAYQIANAVKDLKTLLTPEYMKPIMQLSGNRLGFKTDKDATGGYSEDVIKNCLIEAVLTGVQPFGNQFNIIAGNCYITKEGFGYLLNNMKGLSYEIIPGLPRINAEKTSAAIVVKINFTINNEKKEREIDLPIKMNSFMGADAVIGKATRKARAWLFNTINGIEIGDGDVTEDAPFTTISTKITKTPEQIEKERMELMLQDCKTFAQLHLFQKNNPNVDIELVKKREGELNNGK